MDGIELGKDECSALGIALGDAIGVSTSVTTSSSICVGFVGCFLKKLRNSRMIRKEQRI